MKARLSLLALWACLALLVVMVVSLTTTALEPEGVITVCPPPGAGCDYTVIQEAIDNAHPGDTIRVARGVYAENLTVDKPLTLEGGYESGGWTRDIALYETIVDGSKSRTVAGDWDGGGVRYPSVINNGDMYEMWYVGRDLYDVWRIGYATSSDGLTWTKYASNPVLDIGADGEWDAAGFEGPFVIKEGPTSYKMWYSGKDEDDTWRIGYATSPDGIHWTKDTGNPVLELGGETWNNRAVNLPSVVHEAGLYKMWVYTAGDDGSGWAPYIAYATSTDGIAWTWDANNPLFSRDATHGWESEWIWGPTVLHEGSNYQMWYSGWGGDEGSTGYATAPNETTWAKYNSGVTPVLAGTPGEWDEGCAYDPLVLYGSGTYTMYYDNDVAIGVAISSDGINWNKSLSNPVLEPGTPGRWGQPVVEFYRSSDGSTLDGFTITNGEAWRGGGILVSESGVRIQSCVVVSNSAAFGGGGVYAASGGDIVIDDTEVSGNSTEQRFGGGILINHPDTRAEIRDSVITDNHGGKWGGAGIAVDYYASATLVDNEIMSNDSSVDAGGGVRINNHALAAMQDNLVAYNQAEYGGGIAATYYSTVTLLHNHILSNTIHGWGGGGVAVTDETVVTMQSNEIVSNTADSGAGGGIQIWNAHATITNNTIRGNTASWAAGMRISWQSTAAVQSNIIVGNRATEWDGGGVYIDSYSNVSVNANTITNNVVGGSGGGMVIANGSQVTVTNNVIALNVGPDSDGIAVWGDEDCDVQIINNSIISNAAEGIQADAGTVLARNNVIYGNYVGIHNYQSGATVSSDHNAFWNTGAEHINVTPGPGDISSDPLFVNFASGDYHLRIGSPCINAGTPAGAPATDIEGRPRDAVPDLGAYEWHGFRVYLPIVLKNYSPGHHIYNDRTTSATPSSNPGSYVVTGYNAPYATPRSIEIHWPLSSDITSSTIGMSTFRFWGKRADSAVTHLHVNGHDIGSLTVGPEYGWCVLSFDTAYLDQGDNNVIEIWTSSGSTYVASDAPEGDDTGQPNAYYIRSNGGTAEDWGPGYGGIYAQLTTEWSDPGTCFPLYSDDFEDPSTGWSIVDNPSVTFGYLTGEYQIRLKTGLGAGWVTGPFLAPGDYVMEADMRYSTPVTGTAGLIFDVQDLDHYYYFALDSRGKYSLWIWWGPSATLVSWTVAPGYRPYPESNRLKAERDGNTISLYLNDQLLTSISDSYYSGGAVGFRAEGHSWPDVDVRFDNLRVYPIECHDQVTRVRESTSWYSTSDVPLPDGQ